MRQSGAARARIVEQLRLVGRCTPHVALLLEAVIADDSPLKNADVVLPVFGAVVAHCEAFVALHKALERFDLEPATVPCAAEPARIVTQIGSHHKRKSVRKPGVP